MWFKVDDGFNEDGKFESLEAMGAAKLQAAVTVWSVMGADCARRLTDGFVSRERLLKVLGVLGKTALVGAQALVDARDATSDSDVGYWVEVPGGWRFHKWEKYQPTRKSVEADREAKRQRQQRWRESSPSKRRDVPVDASTSISTDASTGTSRDDAHTRASPDPTRPDPTDPPISPPGGCGAVLELEPGEPEPGPEDTKRTLELVRVGFTRRFSDRTGNPPSWGPDNVRHAATVARWLDSVPDAMASLPKLLDGFFADPWAVSATWPIGALAKNPQRYLAPPKAPRDVRKGFVEPAPPEAWGPATNLDDVFGPESAAEAERRFGGARKAGRT